jgi:hypothetical protein
VQALSPATIFPCYAPADREVVREAADFLQKGADVRVFLEEGELREGDDLAQKAREGRTADVVLVFFSRRSLPPRWARAQWEDALLKEPAAEGVRIGFVRVDDCNSPKVLTPCFELSPRKRDGFRRMKRWIRGGPSTYAGLSPELEVLALAIADRPGLETVETAAAAAEFANACRDDFDATFRVHCPGRSVTALAGDLGWRLGLQLDGDLAANLDRLENFCMNRRFLIVLEGADDRAAEALVFPGRCSTLIATEAGPPDSDPLHDAQRAMSSGTLDWADMCRVARAGRQIATGRRRLAECYELMQQWRHIAEERGDRDVLNESAREMVWILESWGREDDALRLEHHRAREYDEQMRLF